ncbi:MAG: metalloregulator ArsR/SmtB family transcription factor [Candidatus Eremiobacteraeota bacterium]|nr:metalloregulator ArsR/SmtB family transcription factor [Candidatus Eremiobacteraeota bacterium]
MVPEPSGSLFPEDRLSLVFGALAHSARRHILTRLVAGDASVTELAAPFAITPRAVSKHLGVLERAGLITRGKDAQKRPSQLDAVALREAYEWIDAYRALWETRFAQLDALLRVVQKGERNAPKRRRPRR